MKKMMHLYLIILGVIWLAIASIQDVRRKEIDNWISFSLIALALAYRGFYALIFKDYNFFVYGLIGLGVFFVLAYAFYYSRVFAGGDAKLMIGLGAIAAFGSSFSAVFLSLLVYVFLILALGSVYGIIFSFVILSKNKKIFFREFKTNLKAYKRFFVYSFFLFLISLVFVFIINQPVFFLISALILILPFLFVQAKSADNLMIKNRSVKELVVGDWLAENIEFKVPKSDDFDDDQKSKKSNKISDISGKKIKIKADWEGINERDLEILRKYYKGKIKIKDGLAFAPIFLLAFLIFIYLWYSSWFLWKILFFI